MYFHSVFIRLSSSLISSTIFRKRIKNDIHVINTDNRLLLSSQQVKSELSHAYNNTVKALLTSVFL